MACGEGGATVGVGLLAHHAKEFAFAFETEVGVTHVVDVAGGGGHLRAFHGVGPRVLQFRALPAFSKKQQFSKMTVATKQVSLWALSRPHPAFSVNRFSRWRTRSNFNGAVVNRMRCLIDC
jgi:hypothetical protein